MFRIKDKIWDDTSLAATQPINCLDEIWPPNYCVCTYSMERNPILRSNPQAEQSKSALLQPAKPNWSGWGDFRALTRLCLRGSKRGENRLAANVATCTILYVRCDARARLSRHMGVRLASFASDCKSYIHGIGFCHSSSVWWEQQAKLQQKV